MKKCIFIGFILLIAGSIITKGVSFELPVLMSKEAFYAKHHQKSEKITVQNFDEEMCRAYFTKLKGQRYTEDLMETVKNNMRMPEQFEGFFGPQDVLTFYNAKNRENLYKLSLNNEDIKALNLEVTDEMEHKWYMYKSVDELEKEGFYSVANTAMLVAMVGKNIYLSGYYSDCGTSGCWIDMFVRQDGKWLKKKAELVFRDCQANDEKTVFMCDIYGGRDYLKMPSMDYQPLADLTEKYYEIYEDYVAQYMQKRKNTFMH